jgi:hypothetical protein
MAAPGMVYPSGYPTQYDADEFGLIFVQGVTGEARECRVTRYSPASGSRSREQSLAALTDADLRACSRPRSRA